MFVSIIIFRAKAGLNMTQIEMKWTSDGETGAQRKNITCAIGTRMPASAEL